MSPTSYQAAPSRVRHCEAHISGVRAVLQALFQLSRLTAGLLLALLQFRTKTA